ncbi:hypothetical protein, partial [Cohnella laeviribosi]|uniref:hypothetical protein n=1 Tax=Cohnella laeviribosi TaxID=380174 RepID=UPI001B7FA83A
CVFGFPVKKRLAIKVIASRRETIRLKPISTSHYYLMFSRVFSLVLRFSTIDHPERWISHVAMT